MPRRPAVLLAIAAMTLGGCGSGEDDSASTGAASHRYFGDHPGQGATGLRISASDCRELAATVAHQARQPVRGEPEPTPPNSRCDVLGHGVRVSITLDAGYAARQRYSNRMAEQVQFNAADPTKVPHAVPNLGDRSAYNHYASWIPAYSTLYAVRGNRWITLSYAAAGESRARRLTAAAALARRAFSLTAS
jgi:hypothetical protein